jgi:hypothetical protein
MHRHMDDRRREVGEGSLCVAAQSPGEPVLGPHGKRNRRHPHHPRGWTERQRPAACAGAQNENSVAAAKEVGGEPVEGERDAVDGLVEGAGDDGHAVLRWQRRAGFGRHGEVQHRLGAVGDALHGVLCRWGGRGRGLGSGAQCE